MPVMPAPFMPLNHEVLLGMDIHGKFHVTRQKRCRIQRTLDLRQPGGSMRPLETVDEPPMRTQGPRRREPRLGLGSDHTVSRLFAGWVGVVPDYRLCNFVCMVKHMRLHIQLDDELVG